jgi:hypothetical protein
MSMVSDDSIYLHLLLALRVARVVIEEFLLCCTTPVLRLTWINTTWHRWYCSWFPAGAYLRMLGYKMKHIWAVVHSCMCFYREQGPEIYARSPWPTLLFYCSYSYIATVTPPWLSFMYISVTIFSLYSPTAYRRAAFYWLLFSRLHFLLSLYCVLLTLWHGNLCIWNRQFDAQNTSSCVIILMSCSPSLNSYLLQISMGTFLAPGGWYLLIGYILVCTSESTKFLFLGILMMMVMRMIMIDMLLHQTQGHLPLFSPLLVPWIFQIPALGHYSTSVVSHTAFGL